MGDFEKIGKILSNLLSNSIKFTRNGGTIYINVEVTNSYADGCNINFEIKDNGIGIKEKNLEKIFEPFIQVKNPIIQNYKGTGLGLAISKEIVEFMDSKLKIKSVEGEGSKFSFELNFISDKSQAGVQKVTKEVVTSQGKNRILVVDDNGVNRKLMEIFSSINP
jgi:signal transduction histidine kinase